MKYAILIFRKRVAPRCAIADSIIFLDVVEGKIATKKTASFKNKNWRELMKTIDGSGAEKLVCGGVSLDEKRSAEENGLEIFDNVVCGAAEATEAILRGEMKNGFGLLDNTEKNAGQSEPKREKIDLDCLSCAVRVCEKGEKCPYLDVESAPAANFEQMRILDSALDVSFEADRTLCRLSELIYFALEMRFSRIGLAYCVDLTEQTRILSGVLKRFFKVFPVCCKIDGVNLSEDEREKYSRVSCNPLGQAEALNRIGTDLNVVVGLCVGADCLFAKSSEAPVTTLFVKDKSLAHNPIGALYSDYYLKEATKNAI